MLLHFVAALSCLLSTDRAGYHAAGDDFTLGCAVGLDRRTFLQSPNLSSELATSCTGGAYGIYGIRLAACLHWKTTISAS